MAFLTFSAVVTAYIVAFYTSNQSKKIAQKMLEHAQQLALEDYQHQEKPIVIPLSPIFVSTNERSFTIQNIGGGPAFNIHCALYYSANEWFSSWKNGPIAANATYEILADNTRDVITLAAQTSVDGIFHLYNGENPGYRLARLTITYNDIFNITHISIFDYIDLRPYISLYKWEQVHINSRIAKDLESLDCEKTPNARRFKPTY